MAGYNRIVLMGNLTRNPERKQLASGQAVCRLALACNRQFKNRQTNDMVQEVCYVDVDVWGPQADTCNTYLTKGRPVLIEGRLKYDTWQDNDGKTRSKHSIVADRVVFVSGGSDQSERVPELDDQNEVLEPRNEVERELMAQLDSIKKRATDQTASTNADAFGSMPAKRAPKKTAQESALPAE